MHHLFTSLRATAFLRTGAKARRATPLPRRRPSTLAIAFALCAMWSCKLQASSDWPTRPVTEKLVQSGIVPGGTTPAQVAERFKADKQLFADAVKLMGIKGE